MHDKPPLPEHVQRVIAELASDASVSEVWLIGSQVNGTALAESDWDLLVLSAREPESTSTRYAGIDILWTGPSGKTLLEGQTEVYAFAFSDLRWSEQEDGIAQYVGRALVKQELGVAYDTSSPAENRPVSKAVRVWPPR